MIFSRGRAGKHAGEADKRKSGPRHAARSRAGDEPDPLSYEDDDEGVIEFGPGPYDVDSAPVGVARLDLGSLLIPAIDGVEVRVQANPDGGIQQVVLVHGESSLQLGAFAAPRTDGLWDEVRDEIRKSLFAEGVAAQESRGDYGVELRARVRTPEGINDLRFVGVDGPRWMVRAIYQGPAAVDPDLAGPLAECLSGLVVNRDNEARPASEGLPLRLPQEMVEQQQASEVPDGVGEGEDGGADDAGDAPGVNGGAPRQPVRRKPSPRPRRR